MNLKLKSRSSEPHEGYGAGSGTIDTDVYECPCGKGEVVVTHDRIPGFRESDVMIMCDDCSKKYGMVSSLNEIK
jgi:hypothetical protein